MAYCQLRAEIKRRLMEIADVGPNDDIMTLRWSPLSDHRLWDMWAEEVVRQIRVAREFDAHMAAHQQSRKT